MNELSWKPKRKGEVYCAPACGRGCTHAEYLKAQKLAKKLAKQLGGGFKPVVWENMGWHWEVEKNGLNVSYHLGRYGATFENEFWEHDENPKTALKKLLNAYRKELLKYAQVVKYLNEAMKGQK